MLLLKLLLCSIVIQNCASIDDDEFNPLNLILEWRELFYEFPSNEIEAVARAIGIYVPGIGVPIDVAVHNGYRNRQRQRRIFVTIPRLAEGIPITLGTVSNRRAPDGSQLIKAYPNYAFQAAPHGMCQDITSVFRVAIDNCDRLWVLDTGKIGNDQICSPQLLAFDLLSDRLVHRYVFPPNLYRDTSLFITPIVDIPRNVCGEANVYIADVTGFALLVYNTNIRRAWRVENKRFYPNPDYGSDTIAGETFELMDGVFGLSVTPPGGDDNTIRYLYFRSVASISLNRVALSVLLNAVENDTPDSSEFVALGTQRYHSNSHAMDENGNLYFGLNEPVALGCWDSANGMAAYNEDTVRILARNETTLQFVSGIKVVRNQSGKEELWVLSCRFQKVILGTISNREVNFRIQAQSLEVLLGGGNKCTGRPISAINQPQSRGRYPQYF